MGKNKEWGAIFLFFIVLIGIMIMSYYMAMPTRYIQGVSYTILDIDTVCATLPSCFFQNFDTPYGVVIDPAIFVDRDLEKPFFPGVLTLSTLEGIVIYGEVPKADYWSFIPYIFSRGNETLFASLSYGVSNFSLGFHENPEKTKLAMIFTRNASVYEHEIKYLSEFFDGPIVPVYIPNVITDEDQLIILSRATLFDSEDDILNYIRNSGMSSYKVIYSDLPLKLPSVQLPDGNILPLETVKRIPKVILEPRPLNPTEWTHVLDFENWVEINIQNHVILQEIPFTPFLAPLLGEAFQNGYQCIENDINCFGDNPQTIYNRTDDFDVHDGEAILVLGVNHTYFERGFYTQVSMYNNERELGVGSYFPPDNVPFYRHIFPRGIDFVNTRLLERSYIQEPQNIGANSETIIPARCYKIAANNLNQELYNCLNVQCIREFLISDLSRGSGTIYDPRKPRPSDNFIQMSDVLKIFPNSGEDNNIFSKIKTFNKIDFTT